MPYDGTKPAQLTGLDPLFEFAGRRLVIPEGKGRGPFLVYLDPYATGRPYVYFSSYDVYNGYKPRDCAAQGVAPYTMGPYPSQYMNPSKFQLVCGGADGEFGPGGPWHPAEEPADSVARDNHCNFTLDGLMARRP